MIMADAAHLPRSQAIIGASMPFRPAIWESKDMRATGAIILDHSPSTLKIVDLPIASNLIMQASLLAQAQSRRF